MGSNLERPALSKTNRGRATMSPRGDVIHGIQLYRAFRVTCYMANRQSRSYQHLCRLDCFGEGDYPESER